MFDIYIKDFNQNGSLVSDEVLVQTIPSQNIGDLKLLNPSVKVEMGNAESFNFAIESGTKFYDAFNQMKTFMRVVYDGDTIFYGRILTIDNDFWGNRKLRCEGPLAFLNDTSIEGVKEESRKEQSSYDYFTTLINNHNNMVNDPKRSFTLGEVPGHYTSATSSDQRVKEDRRKYGSDGWQDSKGAIEDLRSHYGGYFRVRCPGYKSGNKYVDEGHYIDWMDNYFNQNENNQTIEVGKNVIDLSTTTEIDNIFTVVIPIGNNKTTSSETVDGEKKSTGPKHFYVPGREVTVPSICKENGGPYNRNDLSVAYHDYDDYKYALEKYGRIIKTLVIDDATTPENLLIKCQEWIKNNYQGEVTKFTVKAVDMHQIGDTSLSKIMVGDRVKIIYPVGKEDGSVEKRPIVRTCLSITYDLYNPENNAYTFGIPANILTKSYGLLKQGKSASDASTKPKSTGGTGNTGTATWLEKVRNWLKDHKIYYKHKANGTSIDEEVYNNPDLWPWRTGISGHEKGPPNQQQYFLSTEWVLGIGAYTMYKFTPVGEGDDFDQTKLDKLIQQAIEPMQGAPTSAIEEVKRAVTQTYRHKCHYTVYSHELITLKAPPTHQNIIDCNIIPYVKEEYGFDLMNFDGVKMPKVTVTDSEGTSTTYEAGENGKIVTADMFNDNFSGELPEGWHIVPKYTKDGELSIGSALGADGEWHYWIVDPNDPTNVIETSIRDLKITTINNSNFIGTQINTGYFDEDGNAIIQKFGQGIEKWADGEMTVAHVDGDVIKIGGRETKFSSSVATKLNGQWLGATEYILDEATGKRSAILVGRVGQASMKARLQNDPTKPYYGEYIYDPNGNIEITGDGFWDTTNLALTGGILTVQEGGRPVTYVKSRQLILGNKKTSQSLKEALVNARLFYKHTDGGTDEPITTVAELDNWLDNKDGVGGQAVVTPTLVAQSIFTEEINAINGHFSRIESNYAKINQLDTYIANMGLLGVRNLRAERITAHAGNIEITGGYDFVYNRGGTPPMLVGVSTAIRDLQIVKSGDNYQLQKKNFNETEWQDVGDPFSRATTLSGAWSGRYFTVTASPQENTLLTRFITNSAAHYDQEDSKWKIEIYTEIPSTGTNPEEEHFDYYIDLSKYSYILQSRTVSASFSSNVTVSPTGNYMGLSSVTINKVKAQALKEVTPSESSAKIVNADSGYDCLQSVYVQPATEAYNKGKAAGIGGVHHIKMDYTGGYKGGLHAKNWWNCFVYNSSESENIRIQTNQSTNGIYLPIVMNKTITSNGTYNPWDSTSEDGSTDGVVFGTITVNVPTGSNPYTSQKILKCTGVASQGGSYVYTFTFTHNSLGIFTTNKEYTFHHNSGYT